MSLSLLPPPPVSRVELLQQLSTPAPSTPSRHGGPLQRTLLVGGPHVTGLHPQTLITHFRTVLKERSALKIRILSHNHVNLVHTRNLEIYKKKVSSIYKNRCFFKSCQICLILHRIRLSYHNTSKLTTDLM